MTDIKNDSQSGEVTCNLGIKILQKLNHFFPADLRSPVKHHGNTKATVKFTFISDWTNKYYEIDDLI